MVRCRRGSMASPARKVWQAAMVAEHHVCSDLSFCYFITYELQPHSLSEPHHDSLHGYDFIHSYISDGSGLTPVALVGGVMSATFRGICFLRSVRFHSGLTWRTTSALPGSHHVFPGITYCNWSAPVCSATITGFAILYITYAPEKSSNPLVWRQFHISARVFHYLYQFVDFKLIYSSRPRHDNTTGLMINQIKSNRHSFIQWPTRTSFHLLVLRHQPSWRRS